MDRLVNEFTKRYCKTIGIGYKSNFTDMVSDKNEHEEIFGMSDSHLDFHVSMWCGEYKMANRNLG